MAGGFYDILIAMKFFPKISINISVIFGGKCQTVLQSLKKVKYPDNLYEIVIIEGNHLTKQRNIGTKFSKGEIIYLLYNVFLIYSLPSSHLRNPDISPL